MCEMDLDKYLSDDSNSDRSPVSSDSANGSFLRLWDLNQNVNGCTSSLAALESGTDLEGLIDDKDVAAKAVAFVVNSSRKGVVPLCAHIAKILKAKRRLQKTVELQHQELLKLRGQGGSGSTYSGRTSRSTSPTPPSLQSYNEVSPVNRRRFKGLEHKHSRCSQCSSLSSTSLHDSQTLSPPHMNPSPPQPAPQPVPQQESLYTISSSPIVPLPSKRHHRQHDRGENLKKPIDNHTWVGHDDRHIHHHTNQLDQDEHPKKPIDTWEQVGHDDSQDRVPNHHVITAEMHQERVPNHHVITAEIHSVPIHNERTNSPVASVEASERLSQPIETVSKEVQCSTITEQTDELQRKYQQAAQAQTQLELDLWKAKAEIDRLKLQLKAADDAQEKEKEHVCDMQIIDETSSRRSSVDETSPRLTKCPTTLPQLNLEGISPKIRSNTSPINRSEGLRPAAAVILPGCKCTRCSEHHQQQPKSGRGHRIAPTPPGGTGFTTATTNNKLTVHLDDHVSIKGDRTGYVRYIGHLDNVANVQTIYVGLQLDLPVGRNDGTHHGKRYFRCSKNHGVFLPIQDITTVINKKVQSSKRNKAEIVRKHSLSSDSSNNSTRLKGFPLKRNKSDKSKRLLSADSQRLFNNNKIQPQPPVST